MKYFEAESAIPVDLGSALTTPTSFEQCANGLKQKVVGK
jgi:hypothetical protein